VVSWLPTLGTLLKTTQKVKIKKILKKKRINRKEYTRARKGNHLGLSEEARPVFSEGLGYRF
jgi:hypothetical protein